MKVRFSKHDFTILLHILAGNGSIGLALMLGGAEDAMNRKQVSKERDMVCLSLDGFRRAARLCCVLGKI